MSDEQLWPQNRVVIDMTPPKTLRDEFAMAAISGLLSNPTIGFESFDAAAKAAGKMADAMLAERKKGEK